MEGHTLVITGGSGYVSSVFLEKYFGLQQDNKVGSSHAASSAKTEATKLYGKHGKHTIAINTALGSLVEINISRIKLLDRAPPSQSLDGLQLSVPLDYHQVDMCDKESLNAAFKGADVVLHLASYGMSGREQLHQDIIWKVNVQGTRNVVEACKTNNVQALVFTSTVNVVFGGQRIENGDESLPYFDSRQRAWDSYGNSKTEAERCILQANGTVTADGSTVLRACALRLPGIYGPSERRHIPRVIGIMRQGLFKMTYGDNPTVEFIHAENVTKALVLTASKLLDQSSSVAGQAYFISDGAPINNFEFFRPLTEALGISYPRLAFPTWLIFYVAFMVEMFYWIFHRIYDFQPLLCRAEVYKTGQTHYFSIDKARRDLGYTSDYQNDLSPNAEYYRKLYHPDNQPVKQQNKGIRFLVDLFLVVIIACLIMSCLPSVK